MATKKGKVRLTRIQILDAMDEVYHYGEDLGMKMNTGLLDVKRQKKLGIDKSYAEGLRHGMTQLARVLGLTTEFIQYYNPKKRGLR